MSYPAGAKVEIKVSLPDGKEYRRRATFAAEGEWQESAFLDEMARLWRHLRYDFSWEEVSGERRTDEEVELPACMGGRHPLEPSKERA